MNEKEIAEERKERKKGEKYNGGKKRKRDEEEKWRTGCPQRTWSKPNLPVLLLTLPLPLTELLPTAGLYLDSASSFLFDAPHRVPEITYVLYFSHVGVSSSSRLDIRFLSGSKRSEGGLGDPSRRLFFETLLWSTRSNFCISWILGTSRIAYLRKERAWTCS